MRLQERILGFRNRLVSRPAFRKRVQKNPIFQYFARRNAERLFALCGGFVDSQVLVACIRGGIIDALQPCALTLDELAQRTHLPASRLAHLMDASVALGLCTRLRDQRYALGEIGAALCENPGVHAMILHHSALYEDLADPQALVADPDFCGRLQAYWAYAKSKGVSSLTAADVAEYSSLMAASQDMLADEVLAVAPFADSRRLLDVGGGDASFAIAAAKRWPQLEITVVDLPAVVEHAGKRIRDAGMEQRIRTIGLDFHSVPLPEGYDHISLLRILHDHDDGPAQRLLTAANRALLPGGRLLVAEPLATDTRAGRLLQTYFAMYLLAMGQGRLRSPGELIEMLKKAGFDAVRSPSARMPLVTGVITARQKT